MTAKKRMPEWLLRALISALFAAVGFFGRDIYMRSKQQGIDKAAELDRLKELSSLLDESYVIFVSQNNQVKRLRNMLLQNHGEKVPVDLSYDDIFYKMYDDFTQEEAELQSIIRSTTINSQRRVNQAMSKWLENDKSFKNSTQHKQLAEMLNALGLHLNQWHDKYEAMIPNDKRRSLVYLADEDKHGIRFPQGIEKVVSEIISNWK